MSEQNLKTDTPDTSFALATSFIFGADSQAAVAPSVYPAQTVLNAVLAKANSWSAEQTIAGAPLTFSGNQSAPSWTTSGIRLKSVAGTLTDASSTGTVAAAYTNVLAGDTIAASSATTFTDYFSAFIAEPTAGTNVTMTRKWALGLTGNLRVSGIIASTFTNVNIEFANGSVYFRRTDNAQIQFASSVTSRFAQVAANGSIGFSNTNDNASTAQDTGLVRAAAGIARLTDGSTGGGALQFTERTAPAAPATNNCILFSEDNGAGKTRLVARFPTGADVVLATEA